MSCKAPLLVEVEVRLLRCLVILAADCDEEFGFVTRDCLGLAMSLRVSRFGGSVCCD